MANDRYNFAARLHEFVQHTGDIAAYQTESGTYAPANDREAHQWYREFKHKFAMFHISGQY